MSFNDLRYQTNQRRRKRQLPEKLLHPSQSNQKTPSISNFYRFGGGLLHKKIDKNIHRTDDEYATYWFCPIV